MCCSPATPEGIDKAKSDEAGMRAIEIRAGEGAERLNS